MVPLRRLVTNVTIRLVGRLQRPARQPLNLRHPAGVAAAVYGAAAFPAEAERPVAAAGAPHASRRRQVSTLFCRLELLLLSRFSE